MQNHTKNIETCPFCGKSRTVDVYSDDGIDWCGHGRGQPYYEEQDNGCSCLLGQISKNGATINKACRNCKYQQNGYCDNKQLLKKLSNQFEIESKVRIKDDSQCCEFYGFNEMLLLQHLRYEEA